VQDLLRLVVFAPGEGCSVFQLRLLLPLLPPFLPLMRLLSSCLLPLLFLLGERVVLVRASPAQPVMRGLVRLAGIVQSGHHEGWYLQCLERSGCWFSSLVGPSWGDFRAKNTGGRVCWDLGRDHQTEKGK
jgi:hypothetical protein